MKSYILTITLNPAIDKTVVVPGFQTGRDFREEALAVTAGGKGINVSRVLRHLGSPTLASGLLGGCSGLYLREKLAKEKINNDFSRIKGNSRTSLTIINSKTNELTRVLERGPWVSRKELAAFRKKYLSLLSHSRCVIISGRNIPGVPDSFSGELVSLARKKGIPTVLDTSSRPYELGLREKPFLIKPNLKEAEHVLGYRLNSLSQRKKALKKFLAGGVKIAIITLGSQGAIAANERETILVRPPKVKRLSPVGCGDAFVGGFIAAYLHDLDFCGCLRKAAACGTANALSINPGAINRIMVKRLARKVKITRL